MFGKAVSICTLTVLSQVVHLVWCAPKEFYPPVIATVSAATPTDSGVIYAENGGLNEIGALPNYGHDDADVAIQNIHNQQQNNQETMEHNGNLQHDEELLRQKYYAYIVEHDDDEQEQTSAKEIDKVNQVAPTTISPQLLNVNPEWFNNGNGLSTILEHDSGKTNSETTATAATIQAKQNKEITQSTESSNQQQFSYRYLQQVALNQANGVEIVYRNANEHATDAPQNAAENNNNQLYQVIGVQTNQLGGQNQQQSENHQEHQYDYQIITIKSKQEGGSQQDATAQDNNKKIESQTEISLKSTSPVSSQPSQDSQTTKPTEEPQTQSKETSQQSTTKSYVPYVKVEFHVGDRRYHWGSNPTVEPIAFFATTDLSADKTSASTSATRS